MKSRASFLFPYSIMFISSFYLFQFETSFAPLGIVP
jgi:hypothetical protein